jgi:murein DD-endopeptidase MepM/ murein hydrolase activator NlpD
MARRMHRLRLLVVLAAVPLLMWGVLPVVSEGESLQGKIEAKRQQIEAKRGREQVLTSDITAMTRRIDALQADITRLQARQVRIEADLAAKRAELARIQERLRQTRIRLARLRARLAEARTVLARRLVELYKADRPDMVTVILESDGFAQLLERSEYMQRVSEQDTRIIQAVKAAKAEATAMAKRLGELEDRQRRVTAAVAARREEVVAVKGTLTRRRDAYAGARASKQAVLSRVRVHREELEGDLRALEAEEARIAAQLAAAAAASAGSSSSSGSSGSSAPVAGPVRQGSGGLIWPVNGPIVSGFGMRWGRLHAGVDIAVPAGTAIRAAASGTVVLMGWTGGYGNYTCIDHGGGLSTCYAHQSSYATSAGAGVSQGQVIGYAGCTGHCFGDHVHFEVRVGGAPVDPMGYL